MEVVRSMALPWVILELMVLVMRSVNIDFMPTAIHLHDPCRNSTATIRTLVDDVLILWVLH